jgi:hypothetical protein
MGQETPNPEIIMWQLVPEREMARNFLELLKHKSLD